MAKITNFTIASTDEHPINIEELQNHCDKWAYIRHDDPKENTPHTHFVGMLARNSRRTLDDIAKWAGLPSNMVEIVRSKVGILKYLTHENQPEKVQYTADKVKSNFDITKEIEDENARISDKKRLEEILAGIDNGSYVEYNILKYITQNEFVKWKKYIDLAFQYQNEKGNRVNREMEVWYIYGKAGSGKTSFAKQICKGFNMECYIASSGKNPFDNYKGEPAVILDDARPSDWKFNDFLKLTDNNTASMVGCRYYDKHFYRCKLLIITNCEEIENWYHNLQESDGEAGDQILRRMCRLVHIYERQGSVISGYDKLNDEDMVVDCKFCVERKKSRFDVSKLNGWKVTHHNTEQVKTPPYLNGKQERFTELSGDDDLPF